MLSAFIRSEQPQPDLIRTWLWRVSAELVGLSDTI